MLCEECHQNEAVYTISVMMGEAMTQRHLCADCMAKMNMNIASGNMQKLLGANSPKKAKKCRTTSRTSPARAAV